MYKKLLSIYVYSTSTDIINLFTKKLFIAMRNLLILRMAKVILLQLLFYLFYDIGAIGCNKMIA